MAKDHERPRISLQTLLVELEDIIRQIRELPGEPDDARLETLELFENFVEIIRKRFHIESGPLAYFYVPPGRGS